jgi:type I restriction enzyme, S subunit
MSSKTKTTTTKGDATPVLVPKLRFPEFRGAEGWDVAGLGELTEFVNERIPIERLKLADYVSTENILPDYSGVTKASKLPSTGSATRFRPNDTLVSNIRPYLKKVWFSDKDGGASNDVIVIRAKHELLTQYFPFLLRNDSFIDYVMKGAKGVKMPRGDMDSMKAYPAFYPTKPEQQKIAECLSSVDELIVAQARKVDALKTHKKGLMQQLFPIEGETQPRLRFPDFQDGGEWIEEKVDDLVHLQDGFAFKSTDFVTAQEDVTQVIRITDINNKNTNEDKVYIPSAFLEQNKLGKYSVDDGDLLLSLTGAAGFNFFFWNGGAATINQRTAKVTSKKKPGHALLRLLEPLIHEKINERGEGQNNNLSKEFLSTIVLLVPAPDEQQRIADCLTTLDDLIAAQTQKLDALKTHKKGLMQQLFPSPEEVET